MAGVGDAVAHDAAVAVDVVGYAEDRNPPRGLRRHCPLRCARAASGHAAAAPQSSVMNSRRFN